MNPLDYFISLEEKMKQYADASAKTDDLLTLRAIKEVGELALDIVNKDYHNRLEKFLRASKTHIKALWIEPGVVAVSNNALVRFTDVYEKISDALKNEIRAHVVINECKSSDYKPDNLESFEPLYETGESPMTNSLKGAGQLILEIGDGYKVALEAINKFFGPCMEFFDIKINSN